MSIDVGRKILDVIRASGRGGMTRKQIEKEVKNTICDCEEWISTYLETKEIEIFDTTKIGAELIRIVER